MAKSGQKIVLGLARLFCRDLRCFHLPNAYLLADVPRNFGKTADMTVLVSYCRDYDFGREDGAVLAHTYSLFAKVAVFTRHLQIVLRFPRRDVLRSVKTSEALSDDLPRAVSLNLLGARIPCRDSTRRIQHINGVLFYAFDQSPELLAALTQMLLGILLVG